MGSWTARGAPPGSRYVDQRLPWCACGHGWSCRRRYAAYGRRDSPSSPPAALAGGRAITAHGILQRPSEDVDLIADWQRRADFPTLFATMLGSIDRLDDEDFTEYGVSPDHVTALRQRVNDWRTSLAHD